MQTLTMILNNAPYGDERTWNALRLAKTLVSATVDMKVRIYFIGDAVTAAKKGQKTPEGFYNLEAMIRDLVEHGVEAAACTMCMNARGLKQEDLVDGVKMGTMVMLAKWLEESQKVLSF